MRGPSYANDPQADLAVVQQQHIAGEYVGRQFLIGNSHRMLGAGIDGQRSVQGEFGAVSQLDLSGRKPVDADFRSLQIAEHAHVAAGLARSLAHQFDPACMIGNRAVREIQTHHIHAGAHHLLEHRRIVRGRPQGRDNFRAPQARIHAARCSRISTAGSFLPSTNSRKAPPPVDM